MSIVISVFLHIISRTNLKSAKTFAKNQEVRRFGTTARPSPLHQRRNEHGDLWIRLLSVTLQTQYGQALRSSPRAVQTRFCHISQQYARREWCPEIYPGDRDRALPGDGPGCSGDGEELSRTRRRHTWKSTESR